MTSLVKSLLPLSDISLLLPTINPKIIKIKSTETLSKAAKNKDMFTPKLKN